MLVLPSLDEGFGLPALEAMTIGVPVIASTRGALPEVIGDAGILVDPLDHDGLAAAMTRVLERASRRHAASAMPEWSARSEFSWRASASRLLEAYASAIARRRSRS